MVSGGEAGERRAHGVRRVADDDIRAVADRDRPFRILAKGKTGNAQCGAFLLQPAGIGKHECGVMEQPDHLEIGHRLGHEDAWFAVRSGQSVPVEGGAGAWVHRKDDRQGLRNFVQRIQKRAEHLR